MNTQATGILLSCVGFAVAFPASASAALMPLGPRQVLNVEGDWEIEQGRGDAAPATFDHTAPVPGLVDLATRNGRDITVRQRN